MLFQLLLWGIALYGLVSMLVKAYKIFNKRFIDRQSYHYFILVKNGQEKIEWVIRSIHFSNWVEGKEKKVSVFDLGSSDDTVAIIEKLAYKENKINSIYTDPANRLQLLGLMIEESKTRGEKPVILYLNPHDIVSKIDIMDKQNFESGEIS